MAPAGHREVKGKVDGLRRKPRRQSRLSRTRPTRAMRRRRRARSRANANFAAARGEPAPDGARRRTGRGAARERGASPGGAVYNQSAGDGTTSGQRRRVVGAGRVGDQRVGACRHPKAADAATAAQADATTGTATAGGARGGDADNEGHGDRQRIKNRNSKSKRLPPHPALARTSHASTRVPYLGVSTCLRYPNRLSVQCLGWGGTSPTLILANPRVVPRL